MTSELVTKRKPKITKEKCEFEIKFVDFIPKDDMPGVSERIVYHDCTLIRKNLQCMYPARMCSFKLENEDFYNHFSKAAGEP